MLIIGRFDTMFIGIPEAVPITSLPNVKSFHLCRCNLIQSIWNLTSWSFTCVFIWSTSLTCKGCSKGISISFCVASCPSCIILMCWYVGVLTCVETVGVACSGLFIVFVVCCKIKKTFFVFARGLNSSSGTLKRFGSLMDTVDVQGVFFFRWYYPLKRIFFEFGFAGDSTVSATESPKRKFLELLLIFANFANCGGRYGFTMFHLNCFNSWFAFPGREIKNLFLLEEAWFRNFLLCVLMKLQDIVTYLMQLGRLKTLKLLYWFVCPESLYLCYLKLVEQLGRYQNLFF